MAGFDVPQDAPRDVGEPISLVSLRSSNNDSIGDKLLREAQVVGYGVGGAFADVASDPLSKAPELATAGTIGFAMKGLHRCGTRGKVVAGLIGATLAGKMAYDEYTGDRWSTLGSAMAAAWESEDNLSAAIDASKHSVGALAVDLTVGAAGFKLAGGPVGRRVFEGKMDTPVSVRLRSVEMMGSLADDGARARAGTRHPLRGDRTHGTSQSVADISAGKPNGPLLDYQQAGYRWIPPRNIAATTRMALETRGAGTKPGPVAEVVLSLDSKGMVSKASSAEGLTASQMHALEMINGFSNLANSSQAARDAAVGSSILGRFGLARQKTITTSAIKGSEAYVNGERGNLFTQYLTERYGAITPTELAVSRYTTPAEALVRNSIPIGQPVPRWIGKQAPPVNEASLVLPWTRRSSISGARNYMDS